MQKFKQRIQNEIKAEIKSFNYFSEIFKVRNLKEKILKQCNFNFYFVSV